MDTVKAPTEHEMLMRIQKAHHLTPSGDPGRWYHDRVIHGLRELLAKKSLPLELCDRLLDDLIAFMLAHPTMPHAEIDLEDRVSYLFEYAADSTKGYVREKKMALRRDAQAIVKGKAPLNYGYAVDAFERILLLTVTKGKTLQE